MIHLGICYGHNATVAVIKNGELIFCQSEERLNRLKNSTGFPVQTLDYIYRHIVTPEEVTTATLFQESVYGYLFLKAHGFKSFQYGEFFNEDVVDVKHSWRHVLKSTKLGWAMASARKKRTECDQGLLKESMAYFSRELRLPAERIRTLHHHLAHAYSALPNVREWGRALVFTLDGQGEGISATVNMYDNGKLSVLRRTSHEHSLGYYYSSITELLGMKPNEHEFKVMGLAPYAKRKYYGPLLSKLKSLLRINNDGDWESRLNPAQLKDGLDQAIRHQRFDNVAGAIQTLTEDLVVEWIHYWIAKTGCRDIAVSGGVFMNVKACQKVLASDKIGKMFVVPSAADESTAIGAAIWGSMEAQPECEVKPLQSLYLGLDYSDAEIEKAFEEIGAHSKYSITKPSNINVKVAELLAENQVVARCSGRMEFGARALGNRSILANPSQFSNLQFINDAIKSRDFWMPFTPSILEEEMPRYIKDYQRIFAPYMCITFDATEEAKVDLVAAIHPRDGTARPQCVKKSWNPDYYEIIYSFKKLTGIGGVLNTSFNLHGEPNVCSPLDAIHTLENSGLKNLVLGSYLIQKKA